MENLERPKDNLSLEEIINLLGKVKSWSENREIYCNWKWPPTARKKHPFSGGYDKFIINISEIGDIGATAYEISVMLEKEGEMVEVAYHATRKSYSSTPPYSPNQETFEKLSKIHSSIKAKRNQEGLNKRMRYVEMARELM